MRRMHYILFVFFFSSLVHGMTPDGGKEVLSDDIDTEKSEHKEKGFGLLRQCKEGIEKQVCQVVHTAKEHPFLSLALASLLGIGIYKKSERVRRDTRKIWTRTTDSVKSRFILPTYMKYLELQEYGITKGDMLTIGALIAGGILLKKAHDTFDFTALSKAGLHKGIEFLEFLWHKHPYIVIGLLSGLGITAVGLHVYKALTIPTKKRSVTPMDYFLLDLQGSLRDNFKKSSQLKEFVIKGSLTALVESEAFMNFVCSLSEEQQEYVYSLINEHSETSTDSSDLLDRA